MDERRAMEGSEAAVDGSISAEANSMMDPNPNIWKPPGNYENVEINRLVPGSVAVCLLGRLVNFYDQPTPGKMPPTAKGCLKVLIKDDTGILMVCRVQGSLPPLTPNR